MAITSIHSSPPTHSPTISISSLPTTHQSLQRFSSPTSSSSPCKFGSSLISNDAVTIAAAVEAVALARAAAQAAREAVALAFGVEEEWFGTKERSEGGCGLGRRRESRRRRRRRRRKGFEYLEMEEKENVFEGEKVVLGSVKSGFLSPKEEAELCLCLKEGARLEAARKRVTEAQEHEPTSKQLVKAIGMKRRSIDNMFCRRREARERIIRSYRRLVFSIASGYQGKGLSLQDLLQEGSIGLLRGAEKFDPGSMCEMVAKIAEANNILRKRLRRMPTFDEIAGTLNLKVLTVRLVFERTRLQISLDRAVTDRGHMTLQEIIRGPDETRPEYMVKRQHMKQEMEELLQTLSKRESHILRLHFGLNGERPQSCEEIGRLLKLSRERVRQINGIALTKLQQRSNVDDMRVYIL